MMLTKIMLALSLLLLMGACATDSQPSRLDPAGWGESGTDPRLYDYDPAYRKWYTHPYVNPYVQ